MKYSKYDEAIAALFFYIIQPAFLLIGIGVFIAYLYEAIMG